MTRYHHPVRERCSGCPGSTSTTTPAFYFQWHQFPLKLHFGITANKAQGQTLHKAGVYMSPSFFSHGQLFVAMLRVRDVTFKIKMRNEKGAVEGLEGVYVHRQCGLPRGPLESSSQQVNSEQTGQEMDDEIN